MKNVLKILRLMDENGGISLTNLALVAAIVKTCLAPHVTAAEIALSVAALVSYQYKRWHLSKQTDHEAFESRIKELETSVVSMAPLSAIKKLEDNMVYLHNAMTLAKTSGRL